MPPADQPDILAASHPSDHNTVAVLGLPSNTTAKALRENKALRRREREASRVRKGEMTQEEFDRNSEHAAPFLVSAPLTPPAPASVTPLGQVIRVDDWPLGSFAGCVAVCLPCVLPVFVRGDDPRLFVTTGLGCSLFHRVQRSR